MQERQTIVVILDVERASEAFGQSFEETEKALVVADSRSVEGVVVELDAERFVDRLFELDEAKLSIVDDFKLYEIVGGLKAVVDGVTDRLAIDGQNLIAWLETSFLGERVRLDGADRAGRDG